MLLYQQVRIPDDLDEDRYISGKAALNLPAPEETSGDWHFLNIFYTEKPSEVFVAGRDGRVDTNAIWGDWGIYPCSEGLNRRDLKADGTPYAANHFRAILDLLYLSLRDNHFPFHMQEATEEYLDTQEQKELLISKAREMLPFLTDQQKELLLRWLEIEARPGYKA